MKLLKKGFSDAKIASELETTIDAVRYWRKKNGLKRNLKEVTKKSKKKDPESLFGNKSFLEKIFKR